MGCVWSNYKKDNMSKKTVIIGTDSSETATLVRDIPRCWEEDGVRYVVVQQSEDSTVDGYSSGFYDLFIRTAVEPEAFDVGIATVKGIDVNHVYFTRHPKDRQAAAINKLFASKPGFHEFWPLRTWTSTKDIPQHRQGVVVVRPRHGARGIGQLVYDTRLTNQMSLQKLLLKTRAIPDVRSGEVEFHENQNLTSEEKIAAFNKTLAEQFAALPGSPVWYSGGDRHVGEGWGVFKDCFIQEYVTDIDKEYRIIIGGENKPVYAIERLRSSYGSCSGVSLASASSAQAGINTASETLHGTGMPQEVIDGFTAILREKDFSLYSFDVFTTKSGKWGIFEFSNEFGTESVPNGLVCTEIKKYIQRIAPK